MNKFGMTVLSALMLSGCVTVPPSSELFEETQIETSSNFPIAIWEKKGIQKGKNLRLYFEGDGNPNPRHAIAFDFAQRDTSPNVIYISRPCQWIKHKVCDQNPEIYRSARFHPEIMLEMKELIQYLMRKYQAPMVELIGYDGGAVLALNMATKVPTSRIITIAGITDIDAYNELHNLPEANPEDQENPTENLFLLAGIPQIHYTGQDDNVTPRNLVERFVRRMKNPKSAIVKSVPDTDHINWEGVQLDY